MIPVACKPNVQDWRGQVEACSAMWREEKARRLDGKGRARTRELRREWFRLERERRARGEHPTRCPFRLHRPDVARWHRHRAQAHRQRFARAAMCGKVQVAVCKCRHCGHEHETPIGCGSRWICQSCRIATALRYQREFERRRLGAWWAVQAAGLDDRWRGCGRIGQRFVTLTAPPIGTQPRERIRILLEAWDGFRRDLLTMAQEALAKIRQKQGETWHNPNTGEALDLNDFVAWLRVLEWTPGRDGLGHPHFHVWLCSPYLRRRAIQVAWSRAWSRASGVRRLCIVDVRRVTGSEMTDEHGGTSSVAAELCKYLTKDWIDDGSGRRVAPEVFAQVWLELDGRRLRQTSAGFARFELATIRICPGCETELHRWSLRIDDRHPARGTGAPRAELDLPPVPRDTGPPSRWERAQAKRAEEWRNLHWAELRVLEHRIRRILKGKK